MEQLYNLTIIRFKEAIRNPAPLFWGIIFPILMAWGLGIAFSSKQEIIYNVAYISSGDKIQTVLNNSEKVKGEIKTTFNYNIEDDFFGKTTFKFQEVSKVDADVLIKRGEIFMYLSENAEKVNYHFDPLNPEGKLLFMVLQDVFNGNKVDDKHLSEIVVLNEKGTRSIDFLFPGLLAMGLMFSCLWGVSYNLIEHRSKKLLRRMVATPMKKSSFLASCFISRFVITFVESFILFVFVYFMFDITIQGSILALLLLFISANIAFTGLSILISSKTSNPQVGNGLINLVSMPMMILSGIFFSNSGFPEAMLPIIKAMPLTIFADELRSIFIEGASLMNTIDSILILSGGGLLSFIIGVRIFKWY